LAAKRTKPNRYRPEPKQENHENRQVPAHSRQFFRTISWIFMVAMMSLGAIYTHDAIVQSPFFAVTRIEVSGNHRVIREELLARAGLNRETNLFELHLPAVVKKLERHPWVARATVKRQLLSTLKITIEEEQPLAIVTIENLPDIIINAQGEPFKEYNPETDRLEGVPVISGVDLSLSDSTYGFEGDLFNAIMDLLQMDNLSQVRTIHGNENTGITIKALDIYNKSFYKGNTGENQGEKEAFIPIKLGFDRFEEKLARAREISRYMEAKFPSRTILAMDLYNIKKIFIKTKTEDALHNTLEKGA
jgi:hypothetical protein